MVISGLWAWLEIGLTVLGLVLGFVGYRFSIPILFTAGMICLGLMAMAFGWEAMITRHVVLGRRRGSSRESYSGLAAFLKGIQFNLIGLCVILATVMSYTNSDGRAVFLQMVRRPGIPLIFFGGLLLMQAVISLAGSNEMRRGSQAMVIVNLIVSRLLPGLILLGLGVGALGLGLFELAAPTVFDERGGALLETLYGLE
jgi:hypothetical protein